MPGYRSGHLSAPLRRLFVSVILLVASLAATVAQAVTYPPSGYCLSQTTFQSCEYYTGCQWFPGQGCLLRVTGAPTPPTTAAPSFSPTKSTKSPTHVPSKSPTRAPTMKPTKATKAPTNLPTRRPSKSPTSRPSKAPIVPTPSPVCTFPETRCESIKAKQPCKQFNGCNWTKKKKCFRRVVCQPYPTNAPQPAQQRDPSCILPGGGCQKVKKAVNCNKHSGCKWQNKRCIWNGCVPIPPTESPTTGAPSTAPTRSPLSPTKSPDWSAAPTTLSPSASPTVSAPSVSPTLKPTMSRTRNPTPNATEPTPFPTIPNVIRYCDIPETGCPSISDIEACASWHGCEVKSGVCIARTICTDQLYCGTRGFTYQLAATMLPGCLRADAESCDRQRADVYNNLAIREVCGDAGVIPSEQGGATLRRDIRHEEDFEELTTFYQYELFVHPTLGEDKGPHRGEREVPLRTIHHAVERLREFPEGKRRIVLMGPAVHRLTETVVLTPEDSHTTIYAEPGAVLSGALEVNLEWREHTEGIFVADIPHSVASHLEKLSPMFVNGKPAIRARYPNINAYHEENYVTGRLRNWKKRSQPAATDRIHTRIAPGDFGFYSQASGAGCDGVFNPPISYFCEPQHKANGGCVYQIPQGVDLDKSLVSTLKYSEWQHGDVQLHVFHPQKWGLWTFEIAPLPTAMPTSQQPTTSPSSSAPTLSPSMTPSAAPITKSPTTASPVPPTSLPTSSPSMVPTTSPTASPVTFAPSTNPTTATPSSAPSYSPSTNSTSATPSSAPSYSPSTNSTSAAPSSAPSYSPSTTPTYSPSPELTITGVESLEQLLPVDGLMANSVTDVTLWFSKGGFQEARGDCGTGGGDWFIENTLSLLDSVNEYYIDLLDPTGPKVYYWPNNTNLSAPSTVIEFGVLRNLIRTNGTTETPLVDVHFRHVTFEKTYPTHMDEHEVPSGGDWTVHRGAALFLEGVKHGSVYDCRFFDLGGNGLFLSRFGRDISIKRNEFRTLGSSAILIVGDPMFHSATPWDRQYDENHIENVLVEENVASELGIVVKQSSGVMLAIARSILIRKNVFFEIARAGIVFNDGFGGNNTVERNIIFNTVLETLDHGPFNVWDRQNWFQNPDVNPVNYPFIVRDNLMIGNANGAKGIDLDDGARNYDVSNNIVILGLQKFKGNDITVRGNLLFPVDYACVWMTPMNYDPGNMLYEGNTCISDHNPYYYNLANSVALSLCRRRNFAARSNTFYGRRMRSEWNGCGQKMTVNIWKNQFSQDQDSTFSATPPSQRAQVDMVLEKLKQIFPEETRYWLPTT